MKFKILFSFLILLVLISVYVALPRITVDSTEIRKFQKVDPTIKKWQWYSNYEAYMVDIEDWYEKNYQFPSQTEMETIIKKRMSNFAEFSDKDQWGNPVFYYNGRKDGKCAWYASMGPDGLWFTGSRDPNTIIDRINGISVKSEFRFITDFRLKRSKTDWKFLVIGDDHVVLGCGCIIMPFYVTQYPKLLVAPPDIFQNAQLKLRDIGTYERYKQLYGNQCVVNKFLESELEKRQIKPGERKLITH